MNWNNFWKALHESRPANAQAPESALHAGRMKVRPAKKPGFAGEVFTGVMGIGLSGILLASLLVMQFPVDACLLITALAGLTGLFTFDVVNRHFWEKKIAAQVRETMRAQDKLARAVARNSDDISSLKDGLTETASALKAQGKSLPAAAAGIETKMLGLITERLGFLGRKQKPKIVTHDKPGDAIFELQMPPPPRNPAPVSKLELALNPRGKQFSDTVLTEMVRSAVKQEKIDMFVQPVVALPQRRVKMIELFGRIRARSGIILPAERYMKIAANDQLQPVIDCRLLLGCLQLLRSVNAIPGNVPCVLNIEPSMLRNARFMKELTGFLAQNKTMASRLVFELPQAALDNMDEALIPVMEALARLGCGFSMDRVRRRTINFTRLKKLHIRFIKIDAAWLLREAAQDGGAARISRLKKQLDAAGIDLIVERIENEDQLRELLDFNIDYGQGHLFAKPEPYASWRERHVRPQAGRAA